MIIQEKGRFKRVVVIFQKYGGYSYRGGALYPHFGFARGVRNSTRENRGSVHALPFVKHIWLNTQILGQKTKQNLPKNCSKSSKMATSVCKCSKIFRGSMPPDPPRAFFILNMLQNNSAGKNFTLENMSKFGALFLKKFLNTPQT